MIEYRTFFIPPIGNMKNEKSEWNIPKVVRSVIIGDHEAETFIRFGVRKFGHMLVAAAGDSILGFQLLDWDHHEMHVILGAQILSTALSEEESQTLGAELTRLANDSWELF
jgi:hypothetical protein